MGADLYIKPVFDKNETKYRPMWDKAIAKRDKATRGTIAANKAQKEVDKAWENLHKVGYFRDSYNCWTMLATLKLSWWRDVGPLLTKETCLLEGENLKKFRDMVVLAKQELPDKDTIIKNGGQVSKTGDDSLENIHKYFQDKRQRLIDFLDLAIKKNYPIECSL